MRTTRTGLALLLTAGCLAGEPQEAHVHRWEGRTMGSPYTIQIVGPPLAAPQLHSLQADLEARLVEVNRQMSHYQPDSELSLFNRASAGAAFPVSPEFVRVVRFSLDLAARSKGAFDPTLSPAINLWGFGEAAKPGEVPDQEAIQATLAVTGFQHLSVTADNQLLKDIPGLQLNLSAVAKGFGVDEMVRLLQRHGHTNVYASIAGEVRVLGRNSRGTRWQVGISAPIEHWREGDPMAAAVALSNQAVSTSGDYQKFILDRQGRRLCHLLDPRTGKPVQNNVAAVSVVAGDGMTADALATTLFVLGVEAGLDFIAAWPDAGALFIIRESEGKFHQIPSGRFPSLVGWSE